MVITNNMKVKEIFDHPDLKPYAKYAIFHHEMGKFLFNKKLKWICKLSGWSEEATLSGLQRLADIAQTKESFVYRVYPEKVVPVEQSQKLADGLCQLGIKNYL